MGNNKVMPRVVETNDDKLQECLR